MDSAPWSQGGPQTDPYLFFESMKPIQNANKFHQIHSMIFSVSFLISICVMELRHLGAKQFGILVFRLLSTLFHDSRRVTEIRVIAAELMARPKGRNRAISTLECRGETR